jgi:hypothetical protein
MNSLFIRKLIAKALKHHWFILSIIIGLQYLTGKFMAGNIPQASTLISYQIAFQIHNLLGTLIGIATLTLFISKMYLLYIQRQAKKKSISNAA